MADVENLQRSFVRGLAADNGFDRHGNRVATWDVSNGCEKPIPVVQWSRSTGLAKNLRKPGYTVPVIEITYLTACRSCAVCLWKTARLWRNRAINELDAAERSWFGTLTVRPEQHIWLDHTCTRRFADFRQRPPAGQFVCQVKVLGAEVTKYLKRLRKEGGHPFRYLLVVEKHNSEDTSDFYRGRPHLHILVHEFAGKPLRKEMLQRQWPHGHSAFKVVDHNGKAAWYVSKYISKAGEARMRASLHYGQV